MRVAGTILSLSLLVSAAPAFAQGGSYYDRNNWYNRQSMAQDGQGYISPEQQHLQSPPTYPGDWQQQSYGQQNYGGQNYGRQPPSPYWQTQPGSMQQGMQSGYQSSQLGSQSGPFQTGQTGQRPSAPVSSATQGQIRSSLEASGFKNVTVLPQSYLIRATAPDGSQVVMQVSSDGVYGVVVNSTDQASSSGTGGTSTGGTSSSTGSASASTGGTSGTGGTSSGTGSASTGGASGTGGTSSGTGSVGTADTSGTGGTSSGTSSLSTGGSGETGSTGIGGSSSTGTAGTSGKSSGKGQTTTR